MIQQTFDPESFLPAGGQEAKNSGSDSLDKCSQPAKFAQSRPDFSVEMLKDCKELSAWLKNKPLGHIALVYAGSYLGNPSSAFGHTFLLSWDQSPLSPLATVIDYSGDVPRSVGGGEYVVGGLMGHFPGRFNVMPLASKTFAYGIREGRSLQIFPLKLTPQQIELIWLNLWEVKNIDFRYFFLKENCSYQILYLLSLVDGKVDYKNDNGVYTIPGDTAKVLSDAGLIRSVIVLPSLNKLAARDASPLQPNAWLFERFNFQSDALPDWTGAEKVQPLEHDQGLPNYSSILEAHGSKRFVIGFSSDNRRDSPKLMLGFRPLYHSETDPVAGFDPGNALELLSGRVLIGEQGVSLDRLDLLRLRSLIPNQGFMAGRLWQLEMSLQRRLQQSGEDGLESIVRFGIGRSGEFKALSFWSMAHLGLEKRQDQSAGFIPQIELGGAWSRGGWQLRVQTATDLSDHYRHFAHLDMGYGLTKNQSLNIMVNWDQWQDKHLKKIQMEWRGYF